MLFCNVSLSVKLLSTRSPPDNTGGPQGARQRAAQASVLDTSEPTDNLTQSLESFANIHVQSKCCALCVRVRWHRLPKAAKRPAEL